MFAIDTESVSKQNPQVQHCDAAVQEEPCCCPRCGGSLVVLELRVGWKGKLCDRCEWWRLEDEQGDPR